MIYSKSSHKNPFTATMSHGHSNMGENMRMLDQRLSEIEQTYSYGVDDVRQNISDVLQAIDDVQRKQFKLEHDLAVVHSEDLEQNTQIFTVKSDLQQVNNKMMGFDVVKIRHANFKKMIENRLKRLTQNDIDQRAKLQAAVTQIGYVDDYGDKLDKMEADIRDHHVKIMVMISRVDSVINETDSLSLSLSHINSKSEYDDQSELTESKISIERIESNLNRFMQLDDEKVQKLNGRIENVQRETKIENQLVKTNMASLRTLVNSIQRNSSDRFDSNNQDTGPLRARIERIAEDARIANDKVKSDVQVLRGNIESNEVQMSGLRNHIPEVKSLIGKIDHQLEVMNHSISDENVGIRESITRNYEELTQKLIQLDGNIQTLNWRHSQLQQEIVSIKKKQNVEPLPKSGLGYSDEIADRFNDFHSYLVQINDTVSLNISFKLIRWNAQLSV